MLTSPPFGLVHLAVLFVFTGARRGNLSLLKLPHRSFPLPKSLEISMSSEILE